GLSTVIDQFGPAGLTLVGCQVAPSSKDTSTVSVLTFAGRSGCVLTVIGMVTFRPALARLYWSSSGLTWTVSSGRGAKASTSTCEDGKVEVLPTRTDIGLSPSRAAVETSWYVPRSGGTGKRPPKRSPVPISVPSRYRVNAWVPPL